MKFALNEVGPFHGIPHGGEFVQFAADPELPFVFLVRLAAVTGSIIGQPLQFLLQGPSPGQRRSSQILQGRRPDPALQCNNTFLLDQLDHKQVERRVGNEERKDR